MPNFCYKRIASPELFDKESFRTIKISSYKGRPIYLTIGCPRGYFDKDSQECEVGTRAQRVMYPVDHPLCKVGGKEISKKEYKMYKRQLGSIRIPKDLTPLGKTIFYGSIIGGIAGIFYLLTR